MEVFSPNFFSFLKVNFLTRLSNKLLTGQHLNDGITRRQSQNATKKCEQHWPTEQVTLIKDNILRVKKHSSKIITNKTSTKWH